jgi:hypothetical protein
MTAFLKEHAPDVPVVVGGPLIANHVRSYAGRELATALADTGADDAFALRGEAAVLREQLGVVAQTKLHDGLEATLA